MSLLSEYSGCPTVIDNHADDGKEGEFSLRDVTPESKLYSDPYCSYQTAESPYLAFMSNTPN